MLNGQYGLLCLLPDSYKTFEYSYLQSTQNMILLNVRPGSDFLPRKKSGNILSYFFWIICRLSFISTKEDSVSSQCIGLYHPLLEVDGGAELIRNLCLCSLFPSSPGKKRFRIYSFTSIHLLSCPMFLLPPELLIRIV